LELLQRRRENIVTEFVKGEKKFYSVVIFVEIFCVGELADQNQAAVFVKQRTHTQICSGRSQEEEIIKKNLP
jgi:hypothetical protein